MNELILTVGMSSSGKTTWAEGFVRNRGDWVNVNRDDVRFSLFTNSKRDWRIYKFLRKNEKLVTKNIEQWVNNLAEDNYNIIISDTNLNPTIREKWKCFAKENGYNYSEKVFEVSWEEARSRNIQREGGISESGLWRQYLMMNDYLGRKTYTPDLTKKKAVIVDVDGTIAKVNGRGFFEWDKVGTDLPREEIIMMIQGWTDLGIQPIFLSGRDGICKDTTYAWIKHNVSPDADFPLFMRNVGDMRKDKIIKEELFWEYVAPNYNVIAAVDDRESVLGLWRELGIPNIIDVSGDRHNVF